MIYRWRVVALSKGIRLEQIAQQIGKGLPYVSRLSRGLAKADESLKARVAEILDMETERAWRRINPDK